MREWTIEICPNDKDRRDAGVHFQVVLPHAPKGAPLRAGRADLIVLTNRTDWELVFESVDPAGLVDFAVRLAGGGSAGPFPLPQNGAFVDYCCTDPRRVHRIEIT